jgi:rubredoxin
VLKKWRFEPDLAKTMENSGLSLQWHRRSLLHLASRSVTAGILEVAMEAMRRKLVWVERANFRGWACAKCAWVFNPSEMPTGKSIGEMKENYERQRDKEFQTHVCGEHRKGARDPR